MKNYQSKEWLIENYVEKMLSCKACGLASGDQVTAPIIHRWLKRHGIPIREKNSHMKGARNPRLGQRYSEETKAKISLALTGHKRTPESIEKQRAKMSGPLCYLFGKPRRHGKWFWVETPGGTILSMRSTWEVLFADWLTTRGVIWEYETQTFILADGSAYTPDFFCGETIYEVKGYMTAEDQRKVDGFRSLFPDRDFRIIGKAEMRAMEIGTVKSFILHSLKLVSGRRKTCPGCGVVFLVVNKNTTYCNVLCSNRNNKPKKPKVPFTCTICGAITFTYPSKAAVQKTCSKSCRYIAMSRSRKASGLWFR